MSYHHPDCFRYPSQFSHEVKVCICERLRKAEQRAIAAMREPGRIRVLVEEAEQRGRLAQWVDEASTYREHRQDGYSQALTDIRDVLSSMPYWFSLDTAISRVNRMIRDNERAVGSDG